MIRPIGAFAGLVLLSSMGLAQPGSGVFELPLTCTYTDKNGRTSTAPCKTLIREQQDKYCRDNPKDSSCGETKKPIDIEALTGPKYRPPGGVPSTGPRRTARPNTAPEPMIPVALHDWRFAHPSPALLLSVNIRSLLKSPIWGTLLPVPAADLEKARPSLSAIGQILLSLNPGGTTAPSLLILAKGEVDGLAGAWLRSGEGLQAKRLDAVTMLVGDPQSLKFADLRMRGPATWSSSDRLLKSATDSMKYDAWIGVEPRYLSSLASAFGQQLSPAMAGLASLRSLSLGLYLRDHIRLEASFDTASADLAERLVAALQQANAREKKPGQRWVTAEGTKVSYIEIVEERELKDFPKFEVTGAIGQQVTGLLRSLTNPAVAARSAEPAAPKTTPGAIVIQGLDETKQVPLK